MTNTFAEPNISTSFRQLDLIAGREKAVPELLVMTLDVSESAHSNSTCTMWH